MRHVHFIFVCLVLGAATVSSLLLKPEILPRVGLVKYQTAVSVASTNATYLCFDFGIDPDCGSGVCSVPSNKIDGSSGRIALREKDLRVVACADGEKSDVAVTAYSFDQDELPLQCPSTSQSRGGFAGDSIVVAVNPYQGILSHLVRTPDGVWHNDRNDSIPGFDILVVAHGPHMTMAADCLLSQVVVFNYETNTTIHLDGQTGSRFGYATALSPTENIAVISAVPETGLGEVLVFDTASWRNETLPFPNCTGSTNPTIGEAVSTDGTRIIVGFPEIGFGSVAIYVKGIQGQWVVEQCVIGTAYDTWFGSAVHISGDYALVPDVYFESKGRVNVYHRQEQQWALITRLYGFRAPGDTYSTFGALGVRWANGHAVTVHPKSPLGYVHVFSEAKNWTERVIIHNVPVGRSVSVAGDFILSGCTIFPSDGLTADNIGTQVLPSTIERSHDVVLHHAVGANVSCKFFLASDSSFSMSDAFTLNMGATTTSARAPSTAGTYWLRCRASQAHDTVRQGNIVLTVTDACLTHPCKNGATCVNSLQSPTDYTCSCANEYWGDTCESHACLTHQCENGATCVLVPSNATQYTCACASNFWGSHCEKFGYAPQSSSSTAVFVPQPNVITARITMLLSKQVEFVNFGPLFLGFMIQACGDYNPSLDRFELTSFGQHPLARWPLIQKLVQLFAVVSYETEVEVKIKTLPGNLASGEQLWSRIASQVAAWSKSGEAKYLGDISVTLPPDPLRIQCADGSFKVECPVDGGNSESLSIGLLAGVIIGGVALSGAAAAIWLFVIRPRLKSHTTAVQQTTTTTTNTTLPVVPQSTNIPLSGSEAQAKQSVELA